MNAVAQFNTIKSAYLVDDATAKKILNRARKERCTIHTAAMLVLKKPIPPGNIR